MERNGDPGEGASLRERRESIVVEHMESENRHEFDATMDTFAHPRYEIVPTGDVYDGVDGVNEYFETTRNAFPDQRNELIAMHHADDAVIVEFWLLGTHKGEIRGIAPTGKEFKCRCCSFFIFEGPDLVCERAYFDSATIAAQLLGDGGPPEIA